VSKRKKVERSYMLREEKRGAQSPGASWRLPEEEKGWLVTWAEGRGLDRPDLAGKVPGAVRNFSRVSTVRRLPRSRQAQPGRVVVTARGPGQ